MWWPCSTQKRQTATTGMAIRFKFNQTEFENDLEKWDAEIDRNREEAGTEIVNDTWDYSR